MKRLLFIAMVLLLTAGPAYALKRPRIARTHVLLQQGHPFSCPDPSVIRSNKGSYRYYMACTTDREANALPIWGSKDLVRWRLISYVFPSGLQPTWTEPTPGGVFWAPDIHHIGNLWVVYFAADTGADMTPAKTMVVGVAWSRSIHGPWQSKMLHYCGQFNKTLAVPETVGGVIDPSEAVDPYTHQRYLLWAEQTGWIWAGKLSGDGLTLFPSASLVLVADPNSWEYDPATKTATVEGPSLYYHQGHWYLFYSGGDTWDATYRVGVAISTDPLQPFTRLGSILQSSKTWLGPGGSQNPVAGSDGNLYIFYHAAREINPGMVSENRMLLASRFRWSGTIPTIGNGYAGG